MSHQVVYRKYRSANFGELIGQDHISKTLSNQIVSEAVGHAYLFFGPRGTGKTSTARIFAKTVNCENLQKVDDMVLPCGECDSCRNFSTDDVDIIEMDAASNRGIDDARLLREKVYSQPISHKYKIIILDEAHMLTREAVNALLKIIEEPPQYMIFIFCTTEFHKIPITIASRCQRFKFALVDLPNIKKKLQYIAQKEGKTVSEERLDIIARMAKGSFRDAESLLEQVLYSQNDKELDDLFSLYTDNSFVARFIEQVNNHNNEKLWEVLCELEQNQGDIKQLLEVVLDQVKDLFQENKLNFDQYARFIRLAGGYRSGGKEEFFYSYLRLLDYENPALAISSSPKLATVSTSVQTQIPVQAAIPATTPNVTTVSQQNTAVPQPSQPVPSSSVTPPAASAKPVETAITAPMAINKETVLNAFKSNVALYNIIVKCNLVIDGNIVTIRVNSTLHKIFLEKNRAKEVVLEYFKGNVKNVNIESGAKSEPSSPKTESKPGVEVDPIEEIFNSKFQ